MNLFQLTVRTHEGQRKIKKDMSLRNRRFKTMEMNLLSKEELFDARVNCSPSGIATRRKAHKQEEKWKAVSWKPTQKELRREKTSEMIWKHFGMDTSMNNPTVRDLKALFHEAIRRTPEEQMREFQAEQERARMAVERKRQDWWNRHDTLRKDLNIGDFVLTRRKEPEFAAS